MKNGSISYWYVDAKAETEHGASAGADAVPSHRRGALTSDLQTDVAIVGAGYTGLWAAYYLKRAAPDLRISIIEAEVVGFGASSRNGGWISYGMPGLYSRYAKTHGLAAVAAFQRQVFDSIAEIVRVCREEGIEADIAHEGEIAIATNAAQLRRLEDEYRESGQWGFGHDDIELIDRRRIGEFPRLQGAQGGLYSRHGARVQPAKLALGLAAAVERLGVRIYESTRASSIEPRSIRTDAGYRVTADHIIRGTEAYSNSIAGHERDWLPKLSSMIVTEPLSANQLDEIGWTSNVLARDANHFFSYIQKTADRRIALGGPGIPYLYGSRWDENGRTRESSVEALKRRVRKRFPTLDQVEFSHTWTGVLGIPRDWSATVDYDAQTGLAVAGGYVGDGVSSSNLAARTLRDLILKRDSSLTRLPWVGGSIRKWEIEPLRWIALRGMYRVYSLADRLEEKSNKPRTSRVAKAANVITGRR